jgi:phospholipid-translocating ATPase
LTGLCFSYLILTVLIIVVRRVFTHNVTVFAVRASFMVALVLLLPFTESAYSKRYFNIAFWVMMLYGAMTTLV